MMSFGARDLLDWIPVLVSVIAILVAKRAVTRSVRPVLVFVCEVRDEVWRLQNVGTGPALDVLVAEKDRDEQPWARFKRVPPLPKDGEIRLRSAPSFLLLPTTTLRTTLIRRSAQDTEIDFRKAMFLINPMRTRLLWIHMNGRNDARNVHDCRSCVSLHSGSAASHL
jgi:hypothetical protein